MYGRIGRVMGLSVFTGSIPKATHLLRRLSRSGTQVSLVLRALILGMTRIFLPTEPATAGFALTNLRRSGPASYRRSCPGNIHSQCFPFVKRLYFGPLAPASSSRTFSRSAVGRRQR